MGVPVRLVQLVLAIAILGVMSSISGEAEGWTFLPDKPGEWKKDAYNPKSENIVKYGLSKDEMALFQRKYQSVRELMKRHPVLAAPMGFDLFASYDADYGGSNPKWGKKPVGSVFRLKFRSFVSHPEQTYLHAEACPDMQIQLNELEQVMWQFGLSYNGLNDEMGQGIYLEPQKIGELGGYPVFANHIIAITGKSKPLWVPVTREQYLKALILDFKRQYKEQYGEAEAENAASNDLYQQGLSMLREELDALSPAERRSQAFYNSERESISHLADADDERATPLVIVNPDFYDPGLPRTAVQIVTIYVGFTAGTDFNFDHRNQWTFSNNHSNVRLYDFIKNQDYAQWAALLDAKKK